jgi:uncharacterized protein (DUF1778 family)
MEEVQTGVETAPEAGVQPTEASDQAGVESQSEAGTETPPNEGDPVTAWAKRIASIKAKTEQEVRERLEKELSEKYKDYETYSKYSKELERAARLNGWDRVEDFIAKMDEVEQARRVQEEAERLGIDEETYRKFLQPVNEKLSQYEKQLQELQKEKALNQLEANLKDLRSKYDDFEKYEEKVLDLALQKGYGLEEAYRIASYDDKLQAVKTQAEQEALKKLQENAATSPGALGAEGAEHKTGIMSMSRAEIAALAERVKRGEKVQF